MQASSDESRVIASPSNKDDPQLEQSKKEMKQVIDQSNIKKMASCERLGQLEKRLREEHESKACHILAHQRQLAFCIRQLLDLYT